jgi:hypothetical protein
MFLLKFSAPRGGRRKNIEVGSESHPGVLDLPEVDREKEHLICMYTIYGHLFILIIQYMAILFFSKLHFFWFVSIVYIYFRMITHTHTRTYIYTYICIIVLYKLYRKTKVEPTQNLETVWIGTNHCSIDLIGALGALPATFKKPFGEGNQQVGIFCLLYVRWVDWEK